MIALTPSRNTILCSDVLAEAQNGSIAFTIEGYCAAHWYAWQPAIDQPVTKAISSTPSCSVSNWCCAFILSNRVIFGNKEPLKSGEVSFFVVLLGEDEIPLPNRLTETIKCLSGSIARPKPKKPSLRFEVLLTSFLMLLLSFSSFNYIYIRKCM